MECGSGSHSPTHLLVACRSRCGRRLCGSWKSIIPGEWLSIEGYSDVCCGTGLNGWGGECFIYGRPEIGTPTRIHLFAAKSKLGAVLTFFKKEDDETFFHSLLSFNNLFSSKLFCKFRTHRPGSHLNLYYTWCPCGSKRQEAIPVQVVEGVQWQRWKYTK